MAETVSLITLQGKDELSKVLETNSNQFKLLNTSAEKTNTNINVLNKTFKTTGESLGAISKNSKDAIGELSGFNRSIKGSYRDSVSFGGNLIKTSDTVKDLTSGFKGLALSVTGTKKPFTLFGDSLEGPVSNLRAIADSRDPTEKFFNVLTRVSKPASSSFDFLAKKAKFVKTNMNSLEAGVYSLSATMSNTGSKALSVFATTFDTLATSIKDRGGLFSGAISKTLLGVGDAAEKAGKQMGKVGKQIDPKDLNAVDKAGVSLGKTFAGLESKFSGLADSIQVADFVGNIYLGLRATQDFVNNGLIPATIAGKEAGQAVVGTAASFTQNMGIFTTMGLVAGAIKDGFLGIIPAFRGVKKGVLEVVAQFDDIAIASIIVGSLVSAIDKATMAWADLNSTTDAMTSLGINTFAIEAATSIGRIGENLIFSTQAAKAFGQASITAFAQFEDAASYVTTLTSGAAFKFQDFNTGIESISGAMDQLVNGPLNNMVTSVEASNALYNALSAGVGITTGKVDELGRSVADTNEVLSFMEAGLKLSSATGADAASSMELLSKVTQVYNLSNLQASETAAKLNAIVESGVTTFPQLVGGLSRTASVAVSANISIDELFGSISALTRVMDVQDVQTGYASLISSIAGQGAQAQKAVKELGIQFDIQKVKSDGLLVALEGLNKATNGNMNKLKEILPDQLAFQTAQNLMNVSLQDAKDIMGLVKDASADSLDEIFSNRSQSMVRRMTALTNGFNQVLIDFGQKALPTIEPGMVFMEGLLKFFQEMPEPLKIAIGGLILFHTALDRVVMTTLSLLGSFAQITLTLVTFRVMGLAMKSFGNAVTGTTNAKGGLGDFIQMLQWLIFEEKNILGVWLHLTGINRKYEKHLMETNKAQRLFLSTQQKISDYAGADNSWGIIEGDIKSYQDQLKQVREELKKVKADHEAMPDIGLGDTVKELERIETDLKRLVGQESLARKELLKDSKIRATEALDDTAVEIGKKRAVIAETFVSAFARFDDKTLIQMRNFSEEMSAIMGHASTDVNAKMGAIGLRFKEYLKDVPKEVRGDAEKIFNEYTSLIRGVEGLPTKYKDKVETAYKRLLESIPEAGRDVLSNNQLQTDMVSYIADIGNTIDERRAGLKIVMDRLLSVFPEEIAANKDEINTAFNNLITADPKNLNVREERFKKAIQKTVKNMGSSASAEIREQAKIVQSAFLEFSRVFNEPARKGGNIAWAKIIREGGDKAISALDLLQTEIKVAFNNTSDEIEAQAKEGGNSVKAYFDAVTNVTKKSATTTIDEVKLKLSELERAYAEINIEDNTIKAKLKASYETISTAIRTSALANVIEQEDEKLQGEIEETRQTLSGIGDKEIQVKILSNLATLESRLRSGFRDIGNLTKADIEDIVLDARQKLNELGQELSPSEHASIEENLRNLQHKLGKGFEAARQEIQDAAVAFKEEAVSTEDAIRMALGTLEGAANFDDVILINDSVIIETAARLKTLEDKFKGVTDLEDIAEIGVNEINAELKNIGDDAVVNEISENLYDMKQELATGLEKIDAEVGSEEHQNKVKQYVDQFNEKLKQLVNREEIVGEVKANMEAVTETVKVKTEELTRETLKQAKKTVDGAPINSDLKSGFSGIINELGSMAGFNMGLITDLADVGKGAAESLNDANDSTQKVNKTMKEGTKTWKDYWGAAEDAKANFKDTKNSQNILVASLNVLGSTYDAVFQGIGSVTTALGASIFAKKAETVATVENTAAQASNAVATEGLTLLKLKEFGIRVKNIPAKLLEMATTAKTTIAMGAEAVATGVVTAAKSAYTFVTYQATKAAIAFYTSALMPIVVTAALVTVGILALAKAFGFLPSSTEKARRANIKTTESLKEIREEQAKGAEQQGQSVEAYEANAEALDELSERYKAQATGIAGMYQSLRRVAQSFKDFDLSGVYKSIGDYFSKYSSMLDGIANRIMNIPILGKTVFLPLVIVLKSVSVFTQMISEGFTIVGEAIENLGERIIAVWNAIKDIPILGQIINGFEKAWTAVSTAVKEGAENVRYFTKSLNGANKETQELIANQRLLTDQSVKLAQSGVFAQKVGNAASQRGQEILEDVKNKTRAFTADELIEFQAAETKFVENEKQVISERIASLDALIEQTEKSKSMDEETKKARIEALQSEKSYASKTLEELENSNKALQTYTQNLQVLYSIVEENTASIDIESTNKKLMATYDALPEAAKKAYAEILGLQFSERIAEDGSKVSVVMQSQYDLFNRGQRQKFNAFSTSLAQMANNVTTAIDINSQETLDKLQSDIFSFGESAQEMIAAGFDPDTVLADFEASFDAFKVQLNDAGISADQMDLLDAAGQETILDLILEMHKQASDKIISQNQYQIDLIGAQNKLGMGNEIENMERLGILNQKNAEEEIKLNKKKLQQLEEAGLESSIPYLQLQKDIAIQEINLDVMVFENKRDLLDKENELVEKQRQHEIDLITAKDKMGSGNQLENLEEIQRLTQENARDDIELNKQKLSELAVGSTAYLELQRTISLQETQFDLLVFENKKELLEKESEIKQKLHSVELERLKNSTRVESQLLELEVKRAQLQQEMSQSREAFTKAIEDYQVSALENVNKLETDIAVKAENQLAIFIKRGEAQERSREFEKTSLEVQQKSNELALRKEEIQLRINKSEAKLAIIKAQDALNLAKSTNARKEDLDLLEAQLETAQLTSVELEYQSGILQEQREFQRERIENETQALEARQRAERETYNVDLILEQNRAKLAFYDQEIAKINNVAQIQRLNSDALVKQRENETSLLDHQLEILKKQQEIVGKADQNQQDAYSIAISMAKSDYKRRKLEEEAARARLKNLEAAQQAEERIFELNQKQQKLALEMAVIKADAASSQAKAELAVAEAEAQKVLADVTSTKEQKAAAMLTVQAAEASYQSAQIQQVLTREQKNIFEESVNIERQQFQQEQQNQALEAEANLASKTRGIGDDIRVGNRAAAVARGRTGEQQLEYEREQERQRQRTTPSYREQREIDRRLENEAAELGRNRERSVEESGVLSESLFEKLESNSALFTELTSISTLQLGSLDSLLQTVTVIKDSLFTQNQTLLTPVLTQNQPTSTSTDSIGVKGSVEINLNVNVNGDTRNLDTEALNSQVSSVVYDGLYELFDEMRRNK